MDTARTNTLSTVETICSALENDILSLRFAPGEKITEITLAARYGASRNTLREAIAHLLSQGLLTKVANKGVYVRKFTVADVQEIFHLRSLLEQEAVRMIMDRDIDISAIYNLVINLESIDRQKDWDAYVREDIAFHHALVAAAGSQRLTKLYNSILTEVKLCIYQTRHYTPITKNNNITHRAVLDAITQNDPAAPALLFKHIAHVINRYCSGLIAMDHAQKS